MTGHLYIAPAGAGKTTFVLVQAREHAQRWEQTRVVVGSSRQSIAAHRQLARMGDGSLGVRIHTMYGLAREVLDRTGATLTPITDPVHVRFLRALVDEAGLTYYQPLVRMPGFIRALARLFFELTAALITPAAFAEGVRALGDPPRLAELARLYGRYQERMDEEGWAIGPGLLIKAREEVERSPALLGRWGFLGVDGFTRFRPAELALLKSFVPLTDEIIVTLTGDPEDAWADSVAQPFRETIAQAANAFGVKAEPLPTLNENEWPAPLPSLAQGLFLPGQPSSLIRDYLHFEAAPDMAAEARVALRWLKERIVLDGMPPHQVAIIARDISPYREAIIQTAAEFGLPVQVAGGLPLRQNPAIDALLSLLNLVTPEPEEDDDDARFPFRPTVSAWRSPYFSWRWPDEDMTIAPPDADALDALGRWARVISGANQWRDAFGRRLHSLDPEEELLAEEGDGKGEVRRLARAEIESLQKKWLLFEEAVTPPPGRRPIHDFVRWLERLIGRDPVLERGEQTSDVPFTLDMVTRIRESEDEDLTDRDIAAIIALKETLRGMVWAAEALAMPETTFEDFLADLAGALEATRYEPRRKASKGLVQAMSVEDAAGLRFQAVALLGLAEGAFPAVLREDAFLRGEDRGRLGQVGLRLDPSPRSEEPALFYLAMSRAEKQMLLTRPRLARGGAEWQASPYWRMLVKAAGVTPHSPRHEDLLEDAPVASLPELLLALASHPAIPWRDEMEAEARDHLAGWRHGARVVIARTSHRTDAYDGDLTGVGASFARRFGPDHVWSARRLEDYRSCKFRFFAAHVLHLAERPEPVLGLDSAQLGSLYHRALEIVIREGADVADNAEALIAIWEDVADELLDAAPQTYGFRPTAWWPQTREQIKETIRRTLEGLAAESNDWHPRDFEARFGSGGVSALTIPHPDRPGDALRLRGYIDRVDIDGHGGFRIIDYKLGGVSRYVQKNLDRGEILQLPLYALAAQETLGRGRPVDGFYWSVSRAEASKLRLAPDSADGTIEQALDHAWEAVDGARGGRFAPHPPDNGCPDYCPAAAFCWRYRPGFS